jgi:hypothetical protein
VKANFSKEWLSLDATVRKTIVDSQVKAPVPVGAVAKALGLSVKLATLPVGISGEIRPSSSGFVIKVDRHEAKERQRFTIAHEIAHALLHKDLILENNGLSDDVLYRSSLSNRREAEANRLAADIVMPWSLVEQWMKQFPDSSLEDKVDSIAAYLEVSKIAVQVRIGNGK